MAHRFLISHDSPALSTSQLLPKTDYGFFKATSC